MGPSWILHEKKNGNFVAPVTSDRGGRVGQLLGIVADGSGTLDGMKVIEWNGTDQLPPKV